MSGDAELRAAVDSAIRRHLEGLASGPKSSDDGRVIHDHPSHVRVMAMEGSDGSSPCRIQPAVKCVRCGYCQSYGY